MHVLPICYITTGVVIGMSRRQSKLSKGQVVITKIAIFYDCCDITGLYITVDTFDVYSFIFSLHRHVMLILYFDDCQHCTFGI